MAVTAHHAPGIAGLLERDALLARGDAALERARAGHGSLVLVTGEAGAGKTALVRQFCAAHAGSTSVLVGSCAQLFTPRPLGAILELGERIGGELAAMLEAEAVPYRVATVLVRALREAAPAILVLEDVHLADEATLDVLQLVARRTAELPLLVVVTYREDAVGPTHQLRTVLGELATAAPVERLHVEPLSIEAVAELVEPSALDAGEIHRITGGNAFFVTETIAGQGTVLPETVRDAVLARAARVAPEARAVLEAVAVLSPRAELWLLEHVAGELDSRLDDCLSCGMLLAGADFVGYRHELARLALEESIPPARRARLHRAALDALRRPPDGTLDLLRLSHHAAAAADAGAVLEFAPEAARRAAAVGAHRESAALYGEALRFADTLPPGERAQLLKRYSRECYLTDQAEESIAALQSAAALYRELGDRRGEGDALRILGTVLWCPGRGREAAVVMRRAVDLLETLPPGRELLHGYTGLAFLERSVHDLDGSRAHVDRALELAETIGDPALLRTARAEILWHNWMHEFDARGFGRMLELVERADAQTVGGTWVGLARCSLQHGLYELADLSIERGTEHCHEHGLDLYGLYLDAARAEGALERCRWDEAATVAEHVIRKRMISTAPRTSALVVLALVRARRGDPGAAPLLADAFDLALPTDELDRIVPVALAGAELAWLRGRPEEVVGATERALELAVSAGHRPSIGELRVWRRRAGVEEPLEGDLPARFEHELAGRFGKAADAWRERGRHYESALARGGAEDEESLRRAHTELHALGARPAETIVARRLREHGVRDIARGPRAATRQSAGGLTPRETEVLSLLADGLSNGEIAARLYLSTRTIDHHVSAILRKLAVPSRARACAEATRLGLLAARR